MSRYLYKKIQNISPESLNFQHSGLKLTTLGSDPGVLHQLLNSYIQKQSGAGRRSCPEDHFQGEN